MGRGDIKACMGWLCMSKGGEGRIAKKCLKNCRGRRQKKLDELKKKKERERVCGGEIMESMSGTKRRGRRKCK